VTFDSQSACSLCDAKSPNQYEIHDFGARSPQDREKILNEVLNDVGQSLTAREKLIAEIDEDKEKGYGNENRMRWPAGDKSALEKLKNSIDTFAQRYPNLKRRILVVSGGAGVAPNSPQRWVDNHRCHTDPPEGSVQTPPYDFQLATDIAARARKVNTPIHFLQTGRNTFLAVDDETKGLCIFRLKFFTIVTSGSPLAKIASATGGSYISKSALNAQTDEWMQNIVHNIKEEDLRNKSGQQK
jgi:hypothetical protein